MPFYRRRWDEQRGDDHSGWGSAVYYVWVHDGVVEQQLELYDSGAMLAYDRDHPEDEYGKLTAEPFDEHQWAPFEIDIAEYQRETDVQPLNRAS